MAGSTIPDPLIPRLEQLRADGVDQFYADAAPHKVIVFPEVEVPRPKPILATYGLKKGFAHKHNRLEGTIPASGYYYFKSHYVSRSGTVLDEKRRIQYAPDMISSYWMWYLSKIIVSDVFGRVPSDNIQLEPSSIGSFLKGEAAVNRKIDDSALIVNLVKPGTVVYGHWLLDVFPCIWHFMRCREAREGMGPVKYMITANAPPWAIAYLEMAFAITRDDLILFDDAVDIIKIKRMVVPSLLRVSPLISPRMNGFVDHLLATVRPLSKRDDLPRRVFISRERYATEANKLLVDSEQTQAVFEEMGCTTIRPEEMSWPDQLALFSNAELVAGEFGSGVHNALFGGPEQVPVALLHMKHNWNQSAIAALRGQRLAYIAPTSQRWTGLGKGVAYGFDADMLRDALSDLLARMGQSQPEETAEDEAPIPDGPVLNDEDEATPIEAWNGKQRPLLAATAEHRPVIASDKRRPALLVVATGSYQALWQFCLESQRAYALRFGIEYVIRTQERPPYNGKWTKIVHAIFLLAAGRNVMMVDADAEITRRAPHFGTLLNAHPDRDIFYATGISGRPNSGVMLLRGGKDSAALALLRLCLDRRATSVPLEDFVTEDGENGHIIHFLKHEQFRERAQEIDPAWNSTLPQDFARAYVRHYTNRLRSSLWRGDTMRQLSRRFAPRSEDEFRSRSAAIGHQAGRAAFLADINTDPERFSRFTQTVRMLYRLRRLSPPLPARDDPEAWLLRYEFAAGLLDAATCEVVTRIMRPGMTIVDTSAAPGHIMRTALNAAGLAGRFIALDSPAAVVTLRANVGRVPRTLVAQLTGPDARTIDGICKASRIKTVDLIRIQAEGHEAKVLQGASDVIAAASGIVVIAKIDPAKTRALGLQPEQIIEAAFDLGLIARRINPDFSLAPAGLCDPELASDYLVTRATCWPNLERALLFRRTGSPTLGRETRSRLQRSPASFTEAPLATATSRFTPTADRGALIEHSTSANATENSKNKAMNTSSSSRGVC